MGRRCGAAGCPAAGRLRRQDTVTATPEQAATPTPEVTAESTPEPAVGLSTNPLTGLDDADYTGKRPVAVMLRTLDGAQPQWGIASADVLIEGVTEGNTAGLMALVWPTWTASARWGRSARPRPVFAGRVAAERDAGLD